MKPQQEAPTVEMMVRKQKLSLRERVTTTWPVLVIGVGLAASFVWTAALGWLVIHVIWSTL